MTVKIITGDCRSILADLPSESAHCVVTSPPYWGLRDYGTARWEGGDADCDHRRFNGYVSGLDGGKEAQDIGKLFKSECGKCGARRIDGQLGLEASPEAYVAEMVAVFREVRRVLRKDGTLWLNIGDSYNAYNGGAGPSSVLSKGAQTTERPQLESGYGLKTKALKPKDIVGIPWRLAFALQADGWWLRQDIIWSKPNPMPESVTDRCTKAHEYIFLLSKSERYYYDAEAIKETAARPNEQDGVRSRTDGIGNGDHSTRRGLERGIFTNGFRNKRSVWEVAVSSFSEAHFATFPPALIEPCILAGCPKEGNVLDPFGGAGTTGLVADRLCRNAILIELNPDYASMAERRISGDAPLFAEVDKTIAGGLQ